MAKKPRRPNFDSRNPPLFELPPYQEPELLTPPLKKRIWTANKSKLISRYLYYAIFITKSGNYIDGFAGPQYRERHEMWSARLVLESQPKRLKYFYLFEKNVNSFKQVERLKAAHSDRKITTYQGDFNVNIDKLLASGVIRQTGFTFALLDQRTFECHWATVEKLAQYKTERKIELFYFFANAWFARALAGFKKNREVIKLWWGRDDWNSLKNLSSLECQEEMVERFRSELGYRSVKAWPIYEKAAGGRIMYYMIHATDHVEAPKLMYRAYHRAVLPKESEDQMKLAFETLLTAPKNY